MKDKKALIFGITGQDGILLSNLLIKKKYKVYGFYRDKKKIKLVNKKVLKIYKKDLNNEIISKFIKHKKFDEIYFLIGQSESHSSFKFPEKSLHSNFIIFCHIQIYSLRKQGFLLPNVIRTYPNIEVLRPPLAKSLRYRLYLLLATACRS